MNLKELGFKDLTYLMHPGIYVLCVGEEVVYVGKTTNIFHRFSSPDHLQRHFDKIYFVRCSLEEIDRLEALMILKLKPKQNQSYNFVKSNDYRWKPVAPGPGESTHTITVRGTQLTLGGRRRI